MNNKRGLKTTIFHKILFKIRNFEKSVHFLSLIVTAVKQHLKCADEITKENLDNSANSAIIKSASTPASLQAVVRFQNGSNMSLQHKVSKFCFSFFSAIY